MFGLYNLFDKILIIFINIIFYGRKLIKTKFFTIIVIQYYQLDTVKTFRMITTYTGEQINKLIKQIYLPSRIVNISEHLIFDASLTEKILVNCDILKIDKFKLASVICKINVFPIING